MEIDPSSIRLAEIAPLRWSLEDIATPFEAITDNENCLESCNELGPDGYLDLTLKFNTQEVVQALGNVVDRDCLMLTITGKLKDEFGGNPVVGEDRVLIREK
jgi:hypothetical protein